MQLVDFHYKLHIDPQFDNLPMRKYDEEPCNWETFARSEIFSPFAPRAGWIWRAKQPSGKPHSFKMHSKKIKHEDSKDNEALDKIMGGAKFIKKAIKIVQKEEKIKEEAMPEPAQKKNINKIPFTIWKQVFYFYHHIKIR